MRDNEHSGLGSKLVLGYDYADTGDGRPLSYGTVFYNSPFITLSTADPITGWLPPDVEATLTATVQNLGNSTAQGVVATFWHAKPSMGTLSVIGEIGQSAPVAIGAGLAEPMTCKAAWTPTLDHGAHQCLLVQVECLGEQITAGFEFRADLDRRVGQKNLTIKTPTSPAPMSLTISNPFNTAMASSLLVRSWRITGIEPMAAADLPATLADLLAHAAEPLVLEHLARFGTEVTPSETVGVEFGGFGDFEAFPPFPTQVQQRLRERRGDGTGGVVLAETNLPPASQRLATLRTEAGDATYLHQFVQVIDGIEIGGYTVVTLDNR